LTKLAYSAILPKLMNNVMQKVLVVAATIGILASIFTQKVTADGTEIYGGGAGCTPIYGGGVQCPRSGEVLIDKLVLNPATGIFVDNLGPNDPKYRPLMTATFRIIVRNPADQTLDSIVVTDTLPSYVDFMSGPMGSTYNSASRILTWTVTGLAGGSSQIFDVKVHIASEAVLPADLTVICPTNVSPQPINAVDARSSDGKTDRDTSSFCIEKTPKMAVTPKAGPEHWLLSLLSLGATLKTGLILRRKGK
jgi:uncharacterized repeat protein (TIGR01451 family)